MTRMHRAGRNRLSDMAAAYVREAVISGRLRENEYIRPEELAATLEISVTPAREGLLTLEGEGFVSMVPRKGFVIAPLDADDIRDIYTSQALICGELAHRFALKRTAEELAALKSHQADLEAALERSDFAAYSKANHDFHRTINVGAGARKMLWLLAMTLRYTETSTYQEAEGWISASCTDHHEIIGKIEAGDGPAARAAMSSHLIRLGDALAERFSTESSPEASSSATAPDPAA